MALKWTHKVDNFTLKFIAPFGLPYSGSPRIELSIFDGSGSLVGQGHFKLRRQGYWDEGLKAEFDQLVISQIELDESVRRQGLGTAIVKHLAGEFPQALIVGENPNEDADAWHEKALEKLFPSRMLRLVRGGEERLTPGAPLDERELQ